MAVLLQIKNAHKSYGDQVLLDGAEATLTDDVKVGFIGRNGAGKSTLLRVLLGEEELDRGEVDPPSQAAARLSAAARSVSARRDGPRLSDARQRPARLEMRRSGRPVRAEGRLPGRPARQALRRLADARQAGGAACCTSRICCCSTSRRTFSTCGRRFCWNIFCATIRRPA